MYCSVLVVCCPTLVKKIKQQETRKKMKYSVVKFKYLLSACFVFSSLISFLFFPFHCLAEDISPRLSVSPHTFDLGVLPGEVITDKIKITNKSNVPLPISVRTTDFTARDEIGGMSFDDLSQDISFASRKWIKIENPNFILEPNETEKVNFKVSVPDNAEPGGHYAVVLFEPKLPSFYFKEDQSRAIPVIGVLFLFSVRSFTLESPEEDKLEIVEFSVPKEERILVLENLATSFTAAFSDILFEEARAAPEVTITKKSPQNFILRIKNNDIYHIKPFGRILIYNTFGRKVGEAKVPQKTILPGKIRQFPVEFSPQTLSRLRWLPEPVARFLAENLFFGKYQVKLELQAKSPITAKIFQPDIPFVLTFFSLPWQFWLIFVFLLLLFIFVLLKYKKRIRLAARTLIKGE